MALPLPVLFTAAALPPAIPMRESSGVAEAFDVDVADGVEAPPVAVDEAELVAPPPAPAVGELLFAPEPPAPPVRLTVFVLDAELDWLIVLDCELVLLPEFVPDALFD
jgi:hypothetical protein